MGNVVREHNDTGEHGLPSSTTGQSSTGGVTFRAVALALVFVVVLAVGAFQVEVLYYASAVVTGGPAVWPLSLLVLLAGAMALPWLRRHGLTRRELLVVYSIVLVVSPLCSSTVLFYLLPKVMLYYHMARANPAWETGFLQYIPLWFAPTREAARNGFFDGQSSVPWGSWAVPLAAWSSFLIAAFAASMCILALLQRQWITHERLAFPLAQIPLELTTDTQARTANTPGGLSRSRLLWIGVLASGAASFLSSLSQSWPALPTLPLGPIMIVPWQKVGPLAGLGAFYFTFWPWLIAIVYIIPKEIAFSCWFFWLVRLALHVAGIMAGGVPALPEEVWSSNFPAPYYQGTGAVIAIGLWMLWVARQHLLFALSSAFSRGSGKADAAEPLPYRWALVGLVVCFAWLIGFCWLAGCRIVFGVAMVGLIVGLSVVWARIRAETAMDASILLGHDIMTTPTGTAGLRPPELVTMMTMAWATFPVPSMTFPACTMNTLETFKIADAAGINLRRLTAVLALGFIVALGIGVVVMLTGIYDYGYFGTRAGAGNDWPSMQSRKDGAFIFSSLVGPTPIDIGGLAAMGAGALVCVLLGVARLRFWWWPFHPFGYIVGNSWGMHHYLMAFLFGWVAKSLVIRYGGLRLYRATLPLAVGLIVGDILNAAIWSVVTLVTHGHISFAAYR